MVAGYFLDVHSAYGTDAGAAVLPAASRAAEPNRLQFVRVVIGFFAARIRYRELLAGSDLLHAAAQHVGVHLERLCRLPL